MKLRSFAGSHPVVRSSLDDMGSPAFGRSSSTRVTAHPRSHPEHETDLSQSHGRPQFEYQKQTRLWPISVVDKTQQRCPSFTVLVYLTSARLRCDDVFGSAWENSAARSSTGK